MASGYVRRFGAADTLQATGLVHEVYLRLARRTKGFSDESHFLSTAARTMRHVLVDHARARKRQKRGGGAVLVTLGSLEAPAEPAENGVDVLALDEALTRLSAWDERQSRIVELRFFTGLSVSEVANVMAISEKTVKRDWAMARAWLQRELTGAA